MSLRPVWSFDLELEDPVVLAILGGIPAELAESVVVHGIVPLASFVDRGQQQDATAFHLEGQSEIVEEESFHGLGRLVPARQRERVDVVDVATGAVLQALPVALQEQVRLEEAVGAADLVGEVAPLILGAVVVAVAFEQHFGVAVGGGLVAFGDVLAHDPAVGALAALVARAAHAVLVADGRDVRVDVVGGVAAIRLIDLVQVAVGGQVLVQDIAVAVRGVPVGATAAAAHHGQGDGKQEEHGKVAHAVQVHGVLLVAVASRVANCYPPRSLAGGIFELYSVAPAWCFVKYWLNFAHFYCNT